MSLRSTSPSTDRRRGARRGGVPSAVSARRAARHLDGIGAQAAPDAERERLLSSFGGPDAVHLPSSFGEADGVRSASGLGESDREFGRRLD